MQLYSWLHVFLIFMLKICNVNFLDVWSVKMNRIAISEPRFIMYSIPVNSRLIIQNDPDLTDTDEIPANDYIGTDELPMVHIEKMPPSYEPEFNIRNGDAVREVKNDSSIIVSRFNPHDTIMVHDKRSNTVSTRTIGTRIIPLQDIADSNVYTCGAYSRMIQNRRDGIASAIGHNFLMESDELTQGDVTVYAKAF